MDGLLDWIKTPEGQGLLSMVAVGMAGAQKGQPINSLGRAFTGGLQGYGAAQERQQRSTSEADAKKLRDLQFTQLTGQVDKQAAMDKAAKESFAMPDQGRAGYLTPGSEQTQMLASQGMNDNPEMLKESMSYGDRPATQGGGGMDQYLKTMQSIDPVKAYELQSKMNKSTAPSSLAKLLGERDQIASTNPQDPRLAFYEQMITKETTSAPQTQIVVGEGGAMSAVTMPKVAGQKPTITPIGVTKPIAPGKGGTPEEKEMLKEQTSLSSQQVLDQAEKLFNHPGRAAGTGATSWMGKIPGTEAKGFSSNLETFKSQTFLPMVSALKGMGALSDAEGKKITASVGALDPDMPEKEFEESLKDTTRFLFSKAKAAGLNVQMPSFIESREKPKGGAKFLGFE